MEETMSRKHFVLIAQAIRENIPDPATRQALAAALIPALRACNTRFDGERFLAAVLAS